MSKEVLELEYERLTLSKSYNNIKKISYLAITLSLLSYIVYSASNISVLLIISVILIFIGLIVFAYAASVKVQKEQEYKVKIVTMLSKDAIEEITYEANSCISDEVINNSGLFIKPDYVDGSDFISGVYNNISFNSSNITMYKEEVRRVTNHTSRERIMIFSGKYIIFDLSKNLNMVVKSVECNNKDLLASNLEEVKLESMKYNEKFTTYATKAQDAFYILTPDLQEKILELESKIRGNIYVAFINDKLHVAINMGSGAFKVRLNKPIDEKLINYINSQILLAPAIINEFNLNASKFTK